MQKYIILLILSILNASYGFSQNKKVVKDSTFQTLHLTNQDYKDFVVDREKKNIWAITQNNELVVINLNTLALDTQIEKLANVACISQSKKDSQILIGTLDKQIKKYNRLKQEWEIVATEQHTIQQAFETTNGEIFYLFDEGIRKVGDSTLYQFDCEDFFSVMRQISCMDNRQSLIKYLKRNISVNYIDDKNRIWLGYDFGEWGGDMLLFDTKKKDFCQLDTSKSLYLVMNPVRQIFDNQIDILFIINSISHMGMTNSNIFFIDSLDKITSITYDGEFEVFIDSIDINFDKLGKRKQKHLTDSLMNVTRRKRKEDVNENEYMGAGAYNPTDSSLYFYSHHGFFKGYLKDDLTKLKNWQLIINPALKWDWGMPHAVGSPMNVYKMEMIGNESFVFGSTKNGIGYFDGKKLIMVR